ncbi:MAG: nucleoside deaminase [Cyanobacteria bacterium REEB67]|nr:nucleoside deaminase [Cyanobacteria bacterium REEB67]
MRLALQEALLGGVEIGDCEDAELQVQDMPIGALIVSDGELIVRSKNRKEALGDPTAHAEIQVIREAARKLGSWRLDGLTIYTTLEPCPMCAEAILQSRISRVVFGAYDPISGALGSAFNLYGCKRLYPIPEVTGGVLEEECAQALKEFFRERK